MEPSEATGSSRPPRNCNQHWENGQPPGWSSIPEAYRRVVSAGRLKYWQELCYEEGAGGKRAYYWRLVGMSV